MKTNKFFYNSGQTHPALVKVFVKFLSSSTIMAKNTTSQRQSNSTYYNIVICSYQMDAYKRKVFFSDFP